MATLQAFDGDTLEAALARVTEECGPGARIAQAEKVRTGGVAGFFARERYEVTVEIDDIPDEPADARPSEPMSLLDLVEQVSDQERATDAGTPRPADDDAAPTEGPAVGDRRDGREPAPSTEGPTFQEVLRGIAAEAGLLDDEVKADATHADDVVTGASPHQPAVAPVEWPVATRACREPVDELPPTHTDSHADTRCTTTDEDADAALFGSLGIPSPLLRRTDATASVAQRLLGVLEGIPSAPPVIARRGEVVAVVGDESAAMEAARVMAEELGQTIEDVVVAGPGQDGIQRLGDAPTAEDRAGAWRRCGVPFVVAISPPAGRSGAAWARQMVDALSPVAVWGAVPAERKPEDVTAWAEAIGGVDALAVSGCDATATPAAVLATGIPVASLEGRRASAAAWTALLVERLSV